MEVLPCVSELWWQCQPLLCKKHWTLTQPEEEGEYFGAWKVGSSLEWWGRNSSAQLNVCIFIKEERSFERWGHSAGEDRWAALRAVRTRPCPCHGAALGISPSLQPRNGSFTQPWGSASTCHPTSLPVWTGSSFLKAFLFRMPGKERLLPVKKKKNLSAWKKQEKSNVKRIGVLFLISNSTQCVRKGFRYANILLCSFSLARIQVVFYPWYIL